MLDRNRSSSLIMPAPLLLALLGVAFCAWSASGNALNLCVTSGCSLFQDLTVGGVSMWWVGVAGFAALAFLAISGRPRLGLLGAGFTLVLDACLLVLMLLTAPCAGCLVAGFLFAATYAAFRHTVPRRDPRLGRSALLTVWTVLCIINIASILRTELGTWPMYGSDDAATHMYFSPSCSACREGIAALSGKANVAFFPLHEDEKDIVTIALMVKALERGDNMQTALTKALTMDSGDSGISAYSFSMLRLRFRLLCNKAHVFSAGGQVVPYFEFRGLPAALVGKSVEPPKVRPNAAGSASPAGTGVSGAGAPAYPPMNGASPDYALPLDTGVAGSCGGVNAPPCP